MHARERKIGIHGPDGFPDTLQKTFRAGVRSSHGEGHVAPHEDVVAREAIHEKRPIYAGRCFLIDAIVAHVPHDSDDFAPVVFRAHADPLAEGFRGVAPILACEVL